MNHFPRLRVWLTTAFEWLTGCVSQASIDQLGADTLLSRTRRKIGEVLPTRITCAGGIVLIPSRLHVDLADVDMRLLLPQQPRLEEELSSFAAGVARDLGHEVTIAVTLRKAETHKRVRAGHPEVRATHGDPDDPGLMAPKTQFVGRGR